jgi:hypothetical protein
MIPFALLPTSSINHAAPILNYASGTVVAVLNAMINTQTKMTRLLALSQGLYFFLTGIWPLVHVDSFLWVTGPKTDIWLVKTVGALLIPVSIAIGLGYFIKTDQRSLLVLAMGTNIAFICIDVYYSVTDVISDIYMADAVVEACLLLGWIAATKQNRNHP